MPYFGPYQTKRSIVNESSEMTNQIKLSLSETKQRKAFIFMSSGWMRMTLKAMARPSWVVIGKPEKCGCKGGSQYVKVGFEKLIKNAINSPMTPLISRK